MAIWRKLKEGTITREHIKEHASKIGKDASQSRKDFDAFIRNKATSIIGRRQLEEEKKLREEKT